MKTKKRVFITGLALLLCMTGCKGLGNTSEVASSEIPTEAVSELASMVEEESSVPEPEPEPEPVPVKLGEEFEVMSDAKEVDISDIDVSELDMEEFLASMTKLEKLTMKNCGLDNDGYAALQDAHPDVKIVWDIKTRYWTIPTDSVGFSTLIGLNDNRRLYNDDVKYFKYCTDMVALDIGHNCVSDLSFLEYMPNLRVLILVENYPSDGSSRRLKDISALKYCPHIRYLEFFANDVKDISVLADLKELEDLNFCYNPVESTDAIKDLPNLQKLWIYGTRIPRDQLQELREIYPETTIVTSGSGSVDQGWRSGPHYEAMRNMVKNNVIDEVYAFDLEVDPLEEE
jgi:Leucine-rich repeat (LRR) protein